MFNLKELSKINTSYWYSDNDINKLLNLYLNDGKDVNILLAPDHDNHPELFEENLKRAFGTGIFPEYDVGTINPKLPSVMPIQINGNHWVGIVIIPLEAGGYTIHYADPKGNPMPKEIEQTILKCAGEKSIKINDITNNPLYPQQYNDNDCGPFTVDNLIKILHGKELFRPEDGNAKLLRLQHAKNSPRLFQPLFIPNMEQIKNNLEAIARLQAIHERLVRLQKKSETTIGIVMAQTIAKEGLIPLTTEEEKNLVGMPLTFYRNKLIISLADQLMNIPYKYGRENAGVGIEKKSKYFLKGGLIKLAEDLKSGIEVPETDINSAMDNIRHEFGVILNNFYHLQQQERFYDNYGNYTSLQSQEREKYLENKKILKRIELRIAPKEIQEAEKDRVANELEDKSKDLARLETLEKYLEKYLKGFELEKSIPPLTDGEISTLKNEYESLSQELYGLELERMSLNKSSKEKQRSDYERDERISALNQRVEELANILPPQVILGILYKEMDLQKYRITHTKEYSPMGFSIIKLGEEIDELKKIKRKPQKDRPFPWSERSTENLTDEITKLEEKKKLMVKNLPIQEKLFDKLVIDTEYQQLRSIYYDGDIKSLENALQEIKENISRLKTDVAGLNDIKDFIFKIHKDESELNKERETKMSDYNKLKQSLSKFNEKKIQKARAQQKD